MIYGKKNIKTSTQICTKYMQEGESLERKLARITASNEPLNEAQKPIIFQERKAGVDPMCDIRTDKMAMAQDACDKITRTHMLARANREDFGKKKAEEFTWVTDTNGNIVKNSPPKPAETAKTE